MVLSLRITAPSLPHKYIDIYLYIFKCISAYTYVYFYICIFKLGLGVDSGSQPLSAKKKKKPDPGPSVNNKTPCPKPNPRAPLQKKILPFFFRKNRNATLSRFNPTTPLLLFYLLFIFYLTSTVIQIYDLLRVYCDSILFHPIVIGT